MKDQGKPCGLQGKDEKGTYWVVQVDVSVDGEVANLLDGRPMLIDYFAQRKNPNGQKREVSKSLVEEVQCGNGKCAMCGTQVGVETNSSNVDESRSIDEAMEDFMSEVEGSDSSDNIRFKGGSSDKSKGRSQKDPEDSVSINDKLEQITD